MTISTHRAGPADLDALALLFDGYRQFYGQASDVPRAREWLRERLRFGESVVLVATRAGKPVGFVQLYPMFSSVRTARTWILNDLYVDAGARRGGVGRALLDAAARFGCVVSGPTGSMPSRWPSLRALATSAAPMAPPAFRWKPAATTPPRAPCTAPPAGTKTPPSGIRCHSRAAIDAAGRGRP